ncbi:MAG TPA: WD40 repeat domain-containing protein [Planctomycetaceae bacterium]|jgi:WD40 repeat protein
MSVLIAGVIWCSSTATTNRSGRAEDRDDRPQSANSNEIAKVAEESPEEEFTGEVKKPPEYPDLQLIEREIGVGPFQHDNDITHIAWLDAGRSLLTSSRHGLRVWDVATQKIKWQMAKVGANECLAAVDRAGTRIVATGDWADPQLIEWPSGKLLRKFTKSRMSDLGSSDPQAITLSPDGKKLALAYINTGNHGYVRIYDAETGEQLAHRNGPPTPALCWSPDSQILAVGEQRGIVIFLRPDGTLQRPGIRLANPQQILGLAFNRDGTRLALLTYLGSCGVYSMHDRRPVWTWDAPPNDRTRLAGEAMGGVAFARDDSRLLTRAVQTSKVFDANTGRIELDTTAKWGHANFAVNPQGNLVAFSAGHCCLDIWDTASLQSVLPEHAEHGTFRGLRLSPDRRRILALGHRRIEILNSESLESEGRRELGSWSENGCWSPDARFVAIARGKLKGEQDAAVEIVETGSSVDDPPGLPGKQLPGKQTSKQLAVARTLPVGEYAARGVAWSPDGTRLAVAGVRDLVLWNPQTGEQIWRKNLCTEYEWLERVAISPAGDMIAAAVFFHSGMDGDVRCVRISDGELQGKLATRGRPSRLFFQDSATLLTVVEAQGPMHVPHGLVPVLLEWDLKPLEILPSPAGVDKPGGEGPGARGPELKPVRTLSSPYSPFEPVLDVDPERRQILLSQPISSIVGADLSLRDLKTHEELHHFRLPGRIPDAVFLPGNRVAFVRASGTVLVLKNPSVR